METNCSTEDIPPIVEWKHDFYLVITETDITSNDNIIQFVVVKLVKGLDHIFCFDVNDSYVPSVLSMDGGRERCSIILLRDELVADILI